MKIPETYKRAAAALVLLAAFVSHFALSERRVAAWHFSAPPADRRSVQADSAAEYLEQFVTPETVTAYAHASSLLALSDDSVLAVWYGGSREGAADTSLFMARYNPLARRWSAPDVITDRLQTQSELGWWISKLGNPVLFMGDDHRLWLFYVSVTVGGWSGSTINYKVSSDEGNSWSGAQRLVASPFFNLSTLVKGAPFNFDDNTIGLPIYQEMAGKFGELLKIDSTGRVIEKSRITAGRHSLQPSITTLNKNEALAALRYAGHKPRRILLSKTNDGGRTWTTARKLDLPNPNAAVFLTTSNSGETMLIFNNQEKGRDNLSLAISSDNGKKWKLIHAFENAGNTTNEQRFSYPYLARTRDGRYHLSYTWNKHKIKHIIFNDAWLKERMR